jgi:hypothetical protein
VIEKRERDDAIEEHINLFKGREEEFGIGAMR